MERLTFEDEELRNLCDEYWSDKDCKIICCEAKVYQKLKEYKKLEEQGLLLRLPCKVGSKVYAVYRTCKREDDVEISCLYNEFEPECKRECVKVVKGVEFRFSFLDGYFGKSVFLTRAEAEAKLKELELKE